MKIRSRLMATFMPLVILPVLVIIAVSSWFYSATLLERENEVLRSRNRELSAELQAQYNNLISLGIEDIPFYRNRTLSDLDSQTQDGVSAEIEYAILDGEGRVLVPSKFEGILVDTSDSGLLPPVGDFGRIDALSFLSGQGPFLVYWDQVDASGWFVINAKREAEVLAPIWQINLFTGLIGLGALLLSLAGVFFASRQLSLPLMELASVAGSLGKGGVELRARGNYSGEVGDLAREFNVMAERLENFTQGLEGLVQQRTQDLKKTQTQLIQSEKMASLGRLVAGFSHEINTPLGIAVTANSNTEELVKEIRTSLSASQVSKMRLIDLLDQVQVSCALTSENLNRGSMLIQSFQQVGVDYHGEQSREILLSSYLKEIGHSLESFVANNRAPIQITCPENIRIRTFPGVLWQILSNLTQNSALHAFKGEGNWAIGIAATEINEDLIELRFLDNGVGIPPELRDQVFEPFFTTTRSEGNIGLGLHIVINLVTQKIGGTIVIDQDTPCGTCFIIQMPRKVSVP